MQLLMVSKYLVTPPPRPMRGQCSSAPVSFTQVINLSVLQENSCSNSETELKESPVAVARSVYCTRRGISFPPIFKSIRL